MPSRAGRRGRGGGRGRILHASSALIERLAKRMLEPFDAARHQLLLRRGAIVGADAVRQRRLVNGAGSSLGVLESMCAAWLPEVRHRRPEAALYAQKFDVDIETIAHTAVPLHVIKLVRDRCDTRVDSVVDRPRGRRFRPPWRSERARHIEQFASTIAAGVETMDATPDTVDRLIVRYEDPVLQPSDDVHRLGERLCVRLDHDPDSRRRDDYQHHMTARFPEALVGRWSHDLDQPTVELLADRRTRLLKPFGYDLTSP